MTLATDAASGLSVSMAPSNLSSRVTAFFFEPISTLPIALYRIVFGLTVLVDGFLMVEFLPEFFGTHGVLSRDTAALVAPGLRVNLLQLLPAGEVSLYVFFVGYLLAAVCLTVGWHTRTAATLVWLGMVSLHHRNPLILNSGDTFLRIAAFWLIFSPAGHALSVDSWRAGRLVLTAEPWAQRMIQIQVSVLYATTVWLKLSGADWINGTAVYWVTRLPEFARFPVPYVLDHMWTLRALTWGTLALELALASLVWVKSVRPWVLLAGVLFHLAIDWSMVLAIMQWVLIGAYAVFLDETQVSRLLPGRGAMAWPASRGHLAYHRATRCSRSRLPLSFRSITARTRLRPSSAPFRRRPSTAGTKSCSSTTAAPTAPAASVESW